MYTIYLCLFLISGAHGGFLSISDYLLARREAIVSRQTTADCEWQRTAYFNGISSGSEYALKMLDATGKIPPGIIKGNAFDLGSYDECVDINDEINGVEIRGKYCLFGMVIPYEMIVSSIRNVTIGTRKKTTPLRGVQQLTQAILRGSDVLSLEEIERTLLVSICIPDKCRPADIVGELAMDVSCEMKGESKKLDSSDIVCLTFLAVILLMMTTSSIYEVYLNYYKKRAMHPILVMFSVYTNGKIIFEVGNRNNPNEILCLHGIKSLSLFLVIAGNTIIAKQVPMIVMNDIELWKQSSVFIIQLPLAVDTFLFISGSLLSYNFLYSMGIPYARFNLFLFYFRRYIRITPALGAAYFITVTITRRIGSGPLWSVVFDEARRVCLHSWWSVFSYLQNYLEKDEICLNHTWHLSVDMQLFLISPLVLLPLVKFRRQMLLYGLPLLILASIVCTFLILLLNEVELWTDDYIDLYFYVTHTRLTPWLIGIIFGVLLLKMLHLRVEIDGYLNCLFWLLNFSIMGAIMFAQVDATLYPNKWKTAFYLSLGKAAWCLCLGWIIFSCVNGSAGVINGFLSAPFFQMVGKLSYSTYMVHVTVGRMILMHRRSKAVFDAFENTCDFIVNAVSSMLVAILWMLAFELPIITLERHTLRSGPSEIK